MRLALTSALPLALYVLSAAGPASAASRIVLHSLSSLVNARIDPIVSPGKVSGHVHRVAGGSAFSSNYSADQQRKSKCSNLGVKADNSAYWQPVVYSVLANGSYTMMKSNTRIYYEQPATKPGVKVQPFPYDFRMIAGDPNRKNVRPEVQDDISQIYYCEQQDANGKKISSSESHSMPTKHCDVLVAKSFYPTCWSGAAFDPKNPRAHVRYASWGGGQLGKNCPAGFEMRIPSILFETYYWDKKPKHNNKLQYILANGDTTGYGLHADFASGWDQAVLTRMINECKTVPVEEPPQKACAALVASSVAGCEHEHQIPNEPVGEEYALDYLPGCNLVWNSGPKPTCSLRLGRTDPGWKKQKPGHKYL